MKRIHWMLVVLIQVTLTSRSYAEVISTKDGSKFDIQSQNPVLQLSGQEKGQMSLDVEYRVASLPDEKTLRADAKKIRAFYAAKATKLNVKIISVSAVAITGQKGPMMKTQKLTAHFKLGPKETWSTFKDRD